jgi:hypothetical protein
MNSFPSLADFLSAYFHQDWIDENKSSSWERVVAAYAHDVGHEKLASTHVELSLLIASDRGDLKQFLIDGLGCYYCPEAHGQKTLDWLEQVCVALERAKKIKVR